MMRRSQPASVNQVAIPGVTPPSPGVKTPNLDTRDVLMAADIYTIRIAVGLEETLRLVRAGDHASALDLWSSAVSAVTSLAEILNAVGNRPGHNHPALDEQLGQLALAIQDAARFVTRQELDSLGNLIEENLLPALTRLSDCLPSLEDVPQVIGR